jgi:hypothetical protein
MKNTYILIGVIVVIAGAVYFYMMGGKPQDTGTLAVQNNPEAEVAATRILNLLKQIENLEIKTDLFKLPAYQTLRDYEVPIPSQDVGRPNPFAPIVGAPVQQLPSSPRR